MSLFQIVATWLLRAILCWLLFEGGLSLYQEAARQFAAYGCIRGTNTAVARLAHEAAAIQTRLSEREAVAAAAAGAAWRLEQSADAATILREHLLALGAQAPVVDLSERPVGEDQSEIRLRARWREHAETSPNVFNGLAGRLPSLRVASLSLARVDNGLIAAEAEFVTVVRLGARGPP